jgi:glycine dehydrogenase subunit 2
MTHADLPIFELSRPGRGTRCHWPEAPEATDIPSSLRRATPPALPEVGELEVVRHYTRLSRRNFSIDTHFYPLGSCTMKYNPKACDQLAGLPGFRGTHPLTPASASQGLLSCLYELQEMLAAVTGMKGVALAPMAGAQGEFAGVAMIRAYHRARGDTQRTEILVPSAAHGTNPATATMCGCTVRELPITAEGDLDLDALKAAVGPQTAGIMLTNPSTLGLFERRIEEVARIVHEAGGLLYYDGANLNAILGRVRPGDMGFDVIHLNLHKTFATPHGGGGPGSGAVGVSERLLPFLPLPIVTRDGERYRWQDERDRPQSIGPLATFAGNVGVLLRAYIYIRLLGWQGIERVSAYATLNANYLMARLKAAGFDLPYPTRRASHEFILTMKRQAEQYGVNAMDFGKRLLDHEMHAPTTYFPLLVPECLLIEPTETESRETLDAFVDAMIAIDAEARTNPAHVKAAPHTQPVRRLDDVRASRQPEIVWRPNAFPDAVNTGAGPAK